MPAVRLPIQLEPILPFVKKSSQRMPNACFETYAHLLTFSAALGFNTLKGEPPPASEQRSSQIEPVPWEYFSGDRQQVAIQLIGLVAANGTDLVNNAESLCRLIEDLAAVGGSELQRVLRNNGESGFHEGVGRLLTTPDQPNDSVTI
jgi:hypothetical protein